MKRSVIVFLVVVLFVAFCAQNIVAQSGSCPDWTSGIVPTPGGTYPGTLNACADSGLSHRVSVINDPDAPCSSGIRVESWDPANQGQAAIYLVPPTSQTFPSGSARLRFQMSADRWAISDYDIRVEINSYNTDNQQIGQRRIYMLDFPHVINQVGDQYYTIEVTLPMVQNGYVTVQVIEPTGPFYAYDVFYYGFKLLDQSHWPPLDYCYVNGQPVPTLTPTPSATPTGTPEPTNTPAPSPTPTGTPPDTPTPSHTPTASHTPTHTTTPQTFPTSAGGTPSPFPTRTPPSVPTVPRQNTPTRLPVVSLPTLSLPSLNTPSAADFGTPEPFGDMALTPNPTAAAQATQMAEWSSGNLAVVTRWYTTTVFSTGSFSTTITGTAGYSSVVEIAGVLGESVAAPISYVRLIQTYLPNLWPLVLFLLLAVGWIFFNLVAKYAVSIIGNLGELIRRLIELLPGF